MQPSQPPTPPPNRNLWSLLFPGIFLLLGLKAGLRHDYYLAGTWAALGGAMGVIGLAQRRQSRGLHWLWAGLLVLALAFVGLRARQDRAEGRVRGRARRTAAQEQPPQPAPAPVPQPAR